MTDPVQPSIVNVTLAKTDLGMALLTAIIHVLPLDGWLYPTIVEIVGLSLAWVAYMVWRQTRYRGQLVRDGFRRKGLLRSTQACAVFGAVALLGMAAYGAWCDQLVFNSNMLILVVAYLPWAYLQQFLVQAVFATPLQGWLGRKFSWLVVLLTAAVFASVHAPRLVVMILTFVLGLALTPIYLRWRNLWPLGCTHAWLGIAAYFWVVGEDPWALAFGP